MGPSAVRYAGLSAAIEQLGIPTSMREHPGPGRRAAAADEPSAKYFPVIARACELLAQLVEEVLREGGFPLVLGGDHSIAMGTLAGVSRARAGRRA